MEISGDTLRSGFDAVIGIASVALGYLWKRADQRVDELEKHINTVENMTQNSRLSNKDTLLAIAELRTHISENYSPKLETQNSLARVHEKIEKLNDDVIRHIENLRSDIREDIRGALEITNIKFLDKS